MTVRHWDRNIKHLGKGRGGNTPKAITIRHRRYRDDDLPERRPFFASVSTAPPVDLDFALAHVKEAERLYTGHSARIEFCRARGVDYARVVEYAEIVVVMEKGIATNDRD